jgi:hypothetical protein
MFSSKRKLHITGFSLKGDKITVSINGKDYLIENSRSADKPMLNYLYQELEYRSLKHNDLIHIKSDSSKFELIDTILILNKNNVRPRVFFADPYSNNNMRKVRLINDIGF